MNSIHKTLDKYYVDGCFMPTNSQTVRRAIMIFNLVKTFEAGNKIGITSKDVYAQQGISHSYCTSLLSWLKWKGLLVCLKADNYGNMECDEYFLPD